MRYLILASFVFLTACSAGKVKTAVVDPLLLPQLAGTIAEDLVLDGDYLLSADLHVPPGISLTIKPGSRIYIQPSDSTKIDPEYLSRETEILIRGNLIAKGTSAEPIVFSPVSENKTDILWSGLQLVDTEQVQLEFVVVEQAEAGLLCLNSSPSVKSLSVRRSRYGIILQQQSAPRIEKSLVADGEAGLFCWDQSRPHISQSRFEDLQEEGVYLGRECRGRFVDNYISRTDRAVVLSANSDFPESNLLVDNRLDFVRYPKGAK